MRKFNSIKKSRKKSKDIDEKIEYLDKECQKTGLNEITMGTSGVYQGSTTNPNEKYEEFTAINFNGYPLAMSGDGKQGHQSTGGASIRASDGAAMAPPHPVTGEIRVASTKGGIDPMFKIAIPGERPTPQHRMTGDILWYYNASHNGGQGRWQSLEYNAPGVHGNGVYPGNRAGWGYWGSNFIGFPLLRDDEKYSDLFAALNDSDGIQFNPSDIGTPTTTVFFQNDLGDPSHLPINIGEMSPEAFEYFRRRVNGNNNVASGGVNYDLYNYLDKRFGIEASNWYENNPTLPHESNPYIPPPEAPYVPLASNPNQPVSGTDDKTEIALPPAAILAAMMALGIAFKGAESAWKMYRKYKQQIDQKIKEMKAEQGQTASYEPEGDLLSESILKHFKRRKINEDVINNTKFNTIKKSRKKSKGIDEKIEYLNKECKKNNLQEIMTTSNMYVDGGTVPNQDFINFEGQSQGGYKLGLSAADGNSVGGAIIDTIPSGFSLAGLEGVAFSPPHPVTGQRIYAVHRTTGLGNSTPLRPGVTISRGFSDNPPQYTMGGALVFFDPNYNNGEGKWCNLEWSNFEGSKNNMWGFWDTVKTGQFAGLYKFETDLSLHPCGDIGNKIAGINFGTNGTIGAPQTTVLVKNDLDDPNFLPIDIMGLGAQAFNYLKDKAQNAAQNVKDILNDLKDAGEDFAKDFEEFMDEMGDFVADIGKAAEVYGDYFSGNLEDGDIDNDYLGQDYVDDAFSDAYINDKGTVTVGDNIIGSGGKPQYDPDTGIVTIPFEYDFDTNEEQIMKDPDKYDATQPDKAVAMFIAWLLGGKYGIDSAPVFPAGYATWAAKSLGFGGKPTTGHGITMPIEEVKAKNFPLYSHIMQNK